MDVKELLSEAIGNGIITLDDVRKKMAMMRRRDILKAHKYKIWQGKDGKWYTHFYDGTKADHRRLVKRSTQKELENLIVNTYCEENAEDEITLTTVYPMWLQYFQLHTLKSASVKRYSTEWSRFYEGTKIATIPLKKFNKLMLDEWAHGMIKTNHMTKKQYYTMSFIMRHCMEYAIDRGFINSNPFAQVKINAKMFRKEKKKSDETQVYLENEQPLIIEEAWKEYEENPDNTTSLAVILQFYLGVRPGELVALKESDVSRDHIHIQHMETSCYTEGPDGKFRKTSREVVEHTKTDAGDREIPLIEKAKLVIKLAMAANERNGCSGSYLFMNQGKRITENAIACRLRKYCKYLDIPYRSPHKVRKTVISSMIDEGININTVRKIIGHEDERTTYNNYCYDRKRPEEIVSQLDRTLDKNYNRKNVIDFPNGREKITEVTKNGQISDNKKENPLKIKGFSCISSMRKRRLEPCAASETLIERGFPHIIMPR